MTLSRPVRIWVCPYYLRYSDKLLPHMLMIRVKQAPPRLNQKKIPLMI
jgi:hypothetical protein